MTSGINYVMIKSPRTREELISGIYTNRDGKLLISDYTHNKPNPSGAHKCQHGEVIDVGTLWYDKDNSRSMSWKTKNEIKIGDTAIYYFNDDAWNDGRYYVEGNTVYFFIRYESIYFVIRNEKWTVNNRANPEHPWRDINKVKSFERQTIIPVNGYVLTEPIDIPQSTLTDFIHQKSKTYGHVRYIGTPLEETRLTPFSDEVIRLNGTNFTGYGLKENDLVFFPNWSCKPIMYDTQNFVGTLYAQHRFGMHCVIEDPNVVTLKENSKHVKHDNPYEMNEAELAQAQKEWARIQAEQRAKPKTLYY